MTVGLVRQSRLVVSRETIRKSVREFEDAAEKLIDDNVRLENKLRTVATQLGDALDEINAQRETIRQRDELIAELQELNAKLRRRS